MLAAGGACMQFESRTWMGTLLAQQQWGGAGGGVPQGAVISWVGRHTIGDLRVRQDCLRL